MGFHLGVRGELGKRQIHFVHGELPPPKQVNALHESFRVDYGMRGRRVQTHWLYILFCLG